MARKDSAATPDGGDLVTCAGGIVVIRRRKHEYVPGLDALPHDQRVQRTGKVFGSKFAAGWTLTRITDETRRVVEREGWIKAPPAVRSATQTYDAAVGLVGGESVRTMKVVSDGRTAHGYPVKDT